MTNDPDPSHQAAPASTASTPDRKIIKKFSMQDFLIAAVVGAAIVGFLLFSFFSFKNEVAGLGRPGTIIEKLFVPAPETQITFGKDGLKKEEIAGSYILRVELDRTGEIYNVYVDPRTYGRYTVGENFLVLQPEDGGKDVFDEAAKEVAAEQRR